MKCIVIDDEYPARMLLEDYISRISYLEHTKSFKNPVEAADYLKENKVDLIFVDIQMPQQTGTEFLRSMDEKPLAILTTAYPDYALEGYELDVVDYLVKPIAFERFLQATAKALQRLPKNWEDDRTSYIFIKADHKTHKIEFEDIIYIEGAREYVIFHLKTGKIMALEALRKLEDVLPENFVRIHKSYIVNKEKVTALHGSTIDLGKVQVPIGKMYRGLARGIFKGKT